MYRRRFLSDSIRTSLAAAAVPALAQSQAGSAAGREYYELRRYHLISGPGDKLANKYFEEALIPGLNRLGMKTIGAFSLYIGPETPAVYLLIPADSAEALATAEQRLMADEEYVRAGAAFINAPAKEPAFERVESSMLVAFEGWPKLVLPPATASKSARVFQMRTYESPSVQAHRRKIEMFHAGEFDIFKQAGFWQVFYGDMLIGPRLPNLTYMLSFPDLSEMNAKWKAFSSNPDWKKLTASTKFNYEAIVSNITNLVLNPTSYSQV
jgi:hypothetical protein